MRAPVYKASGFSLVELSIVLVILGLLVGGVLTGQSLIRAAELRAVTTEYGKYSTAIRAFKDKYFAIPGDMSNATVFWGTAPDCTISATTAGTGTQTCNGDGNNNIYAGKEGFRFWQQLANAGLIEGNYTGVTGPNNGYWDAIIGTNIPASRIGNVGWTAASIVYGNDWYFPEIGGAIGTGVYTYTINQLWLGKKYTVVGTYGAFLKPEELWNIDTKLDDGKPGVGIVVANNWGSCTDAANASVAASGTANYRVTSSSIACAIIFMPAGTGL